jgi:hypothetical protein
MDYDMIKFRIKQLIQDGKDSERFSILFDLMMEECRSASMTKQAFMQMIETSVNSPGIREDFA